MTRLQWKLGRGNAMRILTTFWIFIGGWAVRCDRFKWSERRRRRRNWILDRRHHQVLPNWRLLSSQLGFNTTLKLIGWLINEFYVVGGWRGGVSGRRWGSEDVFDQFGAATDAATCERWRPTVEIKSPGDTTLFWSGRSQFHASEFNLIQSNPIQSCIIVIKTYRGRQPDTSFLLVQHFY